MVDLRVPGRIEQRDGRPLGEKGPEACDLVLGVRSRFELRPIALGEFGKTFGIVMPPGAEGGARCQTLFPGVELSANLGDSPRPEAVDKNTHPVIGTGILINSFDSCTQHAAPPKALIVAEATPLRRFYLCTWTSVPSGAQL